MIDFDILSLRIPPRTFAAVTAAFALTLGFKHLARISSGYDRIINLCVS
jgi:hypothetical protein